MRRIMKFKLWALALGIIFCGGLFLCGGTFVWAQEAPKWIKVWEDFAKQSGDPKDVAWAKRLAKPECIALGKAWEDYYGWTASDLLENKAAPEIKPGVVITSKNYKQFPGLMDIWDESTYARLEEGSYGQWGDMRVVPTTHYYYSQGYFKYTKENEGKCKVGADGELQNWEAGIPFPKLDPKDPNYARKIAHNFDRLTIGSDNLTFNPAHMQLFNRKGELERVERLNLQWRNYRGRHDISPVPLVPGQENILEKGSICILYPYDLRGFSAVRVRFLDINKPDDFIAYLPQMRRVRRLSGADTQDPVLGTDLIWEDWKGWWQKFSNKIWPTDFKVVKERDYLSAARGVSPYKMEGQKVYIDWERRPVWDLEALCQIDTYCYKKRMVHMDKEWRRLNYGEYYNVKGKLWRSWWEYNRWEPETGYCTWWGVDIPDHDNVHRTVMKMDAILNFPEMTDEYFDLRFLTKMAH